MDRPNPWLGISFFDVLWLNGCAGSLLFFMWTVRKPADIFDVTEINGASEPEALQLSIYPVLQVALFFPESFLT